MALAPLSIELTQLNIGFATAPSQGVYAVNDVAEVSVGVATSLNVLPNDRRLPARSLTITGISDQVNCSASILADRINVIGLVAGEGSLNYTVSDGISSDVGAVTLTILEGLASVLITDGTHTDFGDEVTTGDTLFYSATTENGETVAVNGLGHVSVTGDYAAGDSFVYRVNSGALQTFTFL